MLRPCHGKANIVDMGAVHERTTSDMIDIDVVLVVYS